MACILLDLGNLSPAMKMNRRTFRQTPRLRWPRQASSACAAAADPIVIASMYDLSGGLEGAASRCTTCCSLRPKRSMRLEVSSVGKSRSLSFDTQTNMQLYAQYAQEAALKHKVAVVHGGITRHPAK